MRNEVTISILFFNLRMEKASIDHFSPRGQEKQAKMCKWQTTKLKQCWKSDQIYKPVSTTEKDKKNTTEIIHRTESHLFNLPSSGISKALLWYLQLILRQAPKRRRIFHSNRMTGQSLGGERRMTGNAAVCQESVHLTPTQSGVSLPAQNTTQILLAPRRQLQTRNHCHTHTPTCV